MLVECVEMNFIASRSQTKLTVLQGNSDGPGHRGQNARTLPIENWIISDEVFLHLPKQDYSLDLEISHVLLSAVMLSAIETSKGLSSLFT